ncbi:MAG: hypothetical protein IJB68_06345 [Ruminococcus sp.]|nr:hypothetical protein [Ruminococcus sp.]
MNTTTLEKINKFTRRQLTEDELYTFSVILCDNEIDRDCERFSDKALDTLRDMFIGKTGIFDHKPSTSNQTARIYDAELITDDSRTTKNGEPYKYLKASAYMVRTDENKNLIAEIDGGIKKEVSISCSAAKRVCSICGRDKSQGSCGHISGKSYGGRICHTVLDGISDAYEWSFVAVPAQVNAGVTKKYSERADEKSPTFFNEPDTEELCREIRQLAFFSGGVRAVERAEAAMKGKSIIELEAVKKGYEAVSRQRETEIQLSGDIPKEDMSRFRI